MFVKELTLATAAQTKPRPTPGKAMLPVSGNSNFSHHLSSAVCFLGVVGMNGLLVTKHTETPRKRQSRVSKH